jgi:multimeric flavodoxin WrbA
MRLTVFNGSPKQGKNNTELIVKEFLAGFTAAGGNTAEVFRLNALGAPQAAEIFGRAEAVLVAFPLYSYSMPAGVMRFVEELRPLLGACAGKPVLFLVQYGFVEAVHARPLEAYLQWLAGKLGCAYKGTIIKGGCDSLSREPNAARNRKILKGAYAIGSSFGATGDLNAEMLAAYSRPERQGFFARLLLRLLVGGINKFYWEAQLKANNALASAYDRPYAATDPFAGR